MNADSAAAAIAVGIEAERLLFLTDVDGLLLDGEVVDSIDLDAAEELIDERHARGRDHPEARRSRSRRRERRAGLDRAHDGGGRMSVLTGTAAAADLRALPA